MSFIFPHPDLVIEQDIKLVMMILFADDYLPIYFDICWRILLLFTNL